MGIREAKGYKPAKPVEAAPAPRYEVAAPIPRGTRDLLLELGRRNLPNGRAARSACSLPTPLFATRINL